VIPAFYAVGSAALGTAFITRSLCTLSRMVGVALFGVSFFLFVNPAFAAADQTLIAEDGGQVSCNASATDITRISLIGDEFAGISKLNTGNVSDDFTVKYEEVRGDIYISVPEGFSKHALSFFGTSKRGYVYRFLCRISGDQAVQVFVSNPIIAKTDAVESGAAPGVAVASTEEAAVSLVQAMYANKTVDGYEMRQRSLNPVYVGDLKVQMIAEYRGDAITGRVLRIENKGSKETTLTEASVAPASALAVSIVEPKLAPGRVTTAYLVSRNGK